MNVVEFLASLAKLDIRLWLEGENLRFSAPDGAFTPEIKQQVIDNKAEIVSFLRQAKTLVEEPIEAVDRSMPLLTSYGQQRLWILDQLNPRDVTYNMSSALKITGELRVDVLEKVFKELVKRHESLRTCFQEKDGNPVQVIKPAEGWALGKVDLTGMSAELQQEKVLQRVNEESITPYDLSTGPLFRAQLLHLAENEYVLVAGMHHIISDAWSMEILVKELTVLYMTFSAGMASPLPALSIQYADYAAWQRQQMESEDMAKQLSYWKQQLEGAPPVLAIPTDRPRQEMGSNNGALLKLDLSVDACTSVQALCARLDITPFMFFLGTWQMLLGRYGASDDVVVGAPIAGRSRNEVQELIGFFVNLLLMRADLTGNPTAEEYFSRIKEMTLQAFSHQDLPIDLLMEQMQVERQPGYPPLAQVAFQLINIQDVKTDNPFGDAPVQIEPIPATHVAARMDMVLGIAQTGDKFSASLEYNTDLFNESTVQAMMDQYLFLIELLVQNSAKKIGELALYDDSHLLTQLGFDASQHDLLPLNPNQLSMFLDQQTNPGTIQNAYGIYVDLPNKPNIEKLQQAIQRVNDSSPVLRMQLVASDLPATDIAYGIIPNSKQVSLKYNEVVEDALYEDSLHQTCMELMHRPYDVLKDDLVSYSLLSLYNRYRLVVSCHHIVLDGASTHILMQKILQAYSELLAGEQVPLELDLGYLEYYRYSRSIDEKAITQYWHKTASQVEPLTFSRPNDRQELATVFGDRVESLVLDKYQIATINEYCAEHNINRPLYFKALFGLMLQQYCRPENGFSAFEFYADRRQQWQSSLGCFYQQFPSVFSSEVIKQDAQLEDWFVALKQQRDSSRNYRQISLQQQNTMFARSRAVFMFNYYNFVDQLEVEGNPVVPIMSAPKVEGGVQFIVKDLGEVVELELRYDCSVFSSLSFLPRCAHINEQILHENINRVSQLNFLSAAEQIQLQSEEVGAVAEKSVIDQFEDVVQQHANNIAVIFQDDQISYEDLNHKINRFAHYLIEQGVKENIRVGVCLNRSIDFLVSVFAVVKAGGAYVPMDPDYPKERLAFIAKDCAAPLVITTEKHQQSLGKLESKLVCVEQVQSQLLTYSSENPNLTISPDQQIYVIYTSGSTGRPKGAMVTHGGEQNLQAWYVKQLELTAHDRTLLISAVGFDLSQKNLFAPLLVGAGIVIPSMDLFDEHELLSLIESHNVTWINCAPSACYPLVESAASNAYKALQSLRYIVLGGEPIRLSALYPWLTSASCKAQLINSYGPTECTDVVAAHALQYIEDQNQIIPIGRPIPNIQLQILNEMLQQVVPGCVGEICISGAGVGLGYIDRPELTKTVFVSNPLGEGTIYKTGDLARVLADGTIEYIGRKDFQVKLNGLRIELGEIEYALKQIQDVQDSLVLVQGGRLIAYIVQDSDELPELWREALREYLPEYMLPSVLLPVKQWPLTPNGKVDRKALPDPKATLAQVSVYVAPRSYEEKQMVSIWEEVLQKTPVGVIDNLFEIGGNSLLATRIVSRVKRQFDVAISVRDLFLTPTIAEFTNAIARAQQTQHIPEIEPVDHNQPLPLSYGQQRLWFLQQLDPQSTAYNMPGAFVLKGALNCQALEQSLTEIVHRHSVLRSRMIATDDTPYQKMDSASSWALKQIDLISVEPNKQQTLVEQHVDALYRHVFDLAQGPLFYVELIKLSKDENVLLVNMHHIVSDGWSNGVLMRELGVLYDAYSHNRVSPLPDLVIQYADFASWQRNWLVDDELERQVSFWRDNLAGVEILNLPTSYRRSAETGFSGNVQNFEISTSLTNRLKQLSRKSGASLYMTTLAAYMVLLSKYTHQDDICVGSPIANRNHEGIEPLIGFFVNTLVMRGHVESEISFTSLLEQVQQSTLQAYAHQDVPFEKLVDELVTERDMLHSPLFQVLFSLQNVPVDSNFSLPGLKLDRIKNHNVISKFDLEFSLMEHGDAIKAEVVYRTGLFDSQYIEQLIQHYLIVLEAIASDPDSKIAEISILGEGDAKIQHGWNNTDRPYDSSLTVHQLFEKQVEKTPNEVAVIYGDSALKYKELDEKANQFARLLKAHNISSGDVVGLLLPRSDRFVIALLGVLKAGATYLPLDPSYPSDRITYMLTDSSAKLVVTLEQCESLINSVDVKALKLDDLSNRLGEHSNEPMPIAGSSENLLYVIYTSGSTGKPKGTGAKHKAEINLLDWYCRDFNLSTQDRVLLVSAIGFDLTQKNLFAPLVSGAALVIPTIHEYDPQLLLDTIKAHNVSWINCAPNAFYPIVEEAEDLQALASLRYVFLGGEPIDFDRLKFWLSSSGTKLVNSYGPTECADIATYHVIDDVDLYSNSNIPIGRPIQNVKLYIVDDQYRMVPQGVPGELCIGGHGVGPGYFNDELQTKDKFIVNPFSDDKDRIYRTGDLARYLPNGDVVYLGRIDAQVKIRGYRIEPGEIEALIRQVPEIHASCVIAVDAPSGNKELVAYLACEEDSVNVDQLRQSLKGQLPEFMVPAYFVLLPALPLTPNGKVAKNLLPPPDRTQTGDREIIPPTSETEQAVLEIWQVVLGIDNISIDDDFFAVGGHSLLATQVVSRLRKHFRINLPLRSLFEAPTIRNTAVQIDRAIQQKDQSDLPPMERIDRDQPLALSFVQQQLWLLDQLDPGTPAYNMPVALTIKGDLDAKLFEQCFNKIMERHETLRTNFDVLDGEPVAIIHGLRQFELKTVELDQLDSVAQREQLKHVSCSMLETGFDLKSDALIRGTLVSLSTDENGVKQWAFVGAIHHIISDGWSLNVLTYELMELYSAAREGRSANLPELDVQYVDVAAWQRKWLSGDVLERHLQFWRDQLDNDGQVLNLVSDYPRPAVLTSNGASIATQISSDVANRARKLAQEEGATLFMILMAVYQLLLHRYTGQERINVGTPIAGRDEVETESLVGFFINTVVISTRVADDLNCRQLLQRVRETTLSAYSHQTLPFEKIVEELKPARDPSRTPFFQVFLNLLNLPDQAEPSSELQIEYLTQEDNHTHAKYDFNLYVSEQENHGLELLMVYNTDLYRQDTVECFLSDFVSLFQSFVQNVDSPVLDASLLSGQPPAWLPNLDVPIQRKQHESSIAKFLNCAQQAPEKIALEYQSNQLSYGELELQSRTLAANMVDGGVLPGEVVAILAGRNSDLVVALLGAMRTGAKFVILDSTYPAERLQTLIEIAKPTYLVNALEAEQQPAFDSLTLSESTKVSSISELLELNANSANFVERHQASEPCYIAFTSGSTGVPKAIVSEFAPFDHFACWYVDHYHLAESDCFTMLSGLGHDPLLRDIFVPLSVGAKIAIPGGDWLLDPIGFVQWLDQQDVSVIHLTPSMGEVIASANVGEEYVLSSIRLMMFGGDRLKQKVITDLKKIASSALMVNGYGATETPQVMSFYEVESVSEQLPEVMPIGQGIDDVDICVVDQGGHLLPPGHVGEIWIRTPYLSMGYQDGEQEAFFVNPRTNDQQDRVYRTGDKGRYRSNGAVEFLGRLDDQIKIRGFRVEPQEIERVINRHDGISHSVVTLAKDLRGDDCLIAYIVSAQQGSFSDELRIHTRQALPEYMVPALFIEIEQIPLTANGKVDKRKLPNPKDFWVAKQYIAPRSSFEEEVAAIWQSVLKMESISVDAHFFDVGGHSLLAVQIVTRVKEKYDVEFSMRRLMEVATIEGMASYVENALWLRESEESTQSSEDDDFEELEI